MSQISPHRKPTCIACFKDLRCPHGWLVSSGGMVLPSSRQNLQLPGSGGSPLWHLASPGPCLLPGAAPIPGQLSARPSRQKFQGVLPGSCSCPGIAAQHPARFQPGVPDISSKGRSQGRRPSHNCSTRGGVGHVYTNLCVHEGRHVNI